MKTVAHSLVVALMIGILAPARPGVALPPPPFREKILPMKIADGDANDPGRVFSVPVTCNQFAADFELGCFGTTRVSSSFAKRCGLQIEPDRTLDRSRDPENKLMFEGAAMATIEIGGQERTV